MEENNNQTMIKLNEAADKEYTSKELDSILEELCGSEDTAQGFNRLSVV